LQSKEIIKFKPSKKLTRITTASRVQIRVSEKMFFVRGRLSLETFIGAHSVFAKWTGDQRAISFQPEMEGSCFQNSCQWPYGHIFKSARFLQ